MTDAERQEWESRVGLHPTTNANAKITESSRLTRIAAQHVELCHCEDDRISWTTLGWIACAILTMTAIAGLSGGI